MTNQSIDEWVEDLKRLDVQLWVEGDRAASLDSLRLRCTAPEGILTPELRQKLIDRKAELVSYLQSSPGSLRQPIQPLLVPIPSSTSEPIFPLSFAQQRLWFLDQLAPNNPFYNVPAAIRLTGMLNQAALARSFQEIVRRHATLRTRFTTCEGQPVQVVESDRTVELAVVNLPSISDSDAAETVRDRLSQQLTMAEVQRPFNLTTDPLLRVTLLQFDPTHAVLLLTLHHIVADGWSLGVLIRELADCYAAFDQGQLPQLPQLPIQYTDFVRWQRDSLQGAVLEKQLAYWRKQLQDLPVLELPHDRPRPIVQTYRGATYPLQLSPALTLGLETLSQRSGTSLFMTLLAAFQTLLYRYTGQEDLAIGAPIANRDRSELEGLIGFFVNSLVLRTDLSGNPPFRVLLERVRQVALAAYEHQDLPFEKLVEALDPDRDLSRNPLFQVAFALQNAPMQPLELPGLTLEPAPLESGSTRFDLEVHLWEPAHGLRSLWQSEAGLSGFIAYSTDLFDRHRIGRLVGHFQTLLAGIVANPEARLSELPLLTPEEYQQQTIAISQPASQSAMDGASVSIGTNDCFHHRFEQQVRLTPAAIALVSEQGSLTYAELNQQADRLAQILCQSGVQPQALVGLCVDRSADWVVGILGILKAGGAYVPLDPHYPRDRLQFLLTDTQVALLLTQSWWVKSLPPSPAKILCLDQILAPADNSFKPGEQGVVELAADNSLEQNLVGRSITADHLAYVIYTSGSTGTPKGVLLTHRGLCNVVVAQQQIFQPSSNSRVLQFSSPSFDASIFEIALALGSGGTLYIPPPAAQLPGIALTQFLATHAITHALLTPAVLSVLPWAQLPDLQVLITGGEACSPQVVDRWAVDRCFFNAYGPTETTIWATVAALQPSDHPATIGRPILNTQAYILDSHLNPVPVGIPGELYIGGVGLAQGYLNRPELTAARFLQVQDTTLYRTGDRAQYRSDGAIEFLGRGDHQVKIRGFRVELGEIEATLQGHPAVQDAVVIPAASNDRLIAYFSLDSVHKTRAHPAIQSLQAQHLQHWQTLYNQTYQPLNQLLANPESADRPPFDISFDITGWNSSYTGEPIPAEQMQEWVNDRVQQILVLKPKRVLEIGCGTGLLLFQIAPHCQQYVGTDFSAVSLQSLQHQVNHLNLSQVELLHQDAADFTGLDTAGFDLVILNSIVQYFPSADYLLQVLQGALKSMAMGGTLFVGDVRSLPLLTAFHAWMKFSQAEDSLERNLLQQQVTRSEFEEPELAINPAFFESLSDRFPQVCRVQIRLARGRSQNEMTQFRYNVLLHIQDKSEDKFTDFSLSGSPCSNAVQQYNWKLNSVTIAEIKQHLVATAPEIVVITNVTNRRVCAAVKTATWLRDKAAPKTVGRMRDVLNQVTEPAIDPQDWWDLEAVLPYTIEITWSTQTQTGDYDVILIRRGIEFKDWPSQRPSSYPDTNDPLQSSFARDLIPELRQYVRQTLPDYMVPSNFVPLQRLPLTSSGKVDRVSIAEQSRGDFSGSSENSLRSSTLETLALTTTETTLIEIWKELLRLKQLTVHDNFFESGGHSLLATQMTSRVRNAFGLELPLKYVFEAPTIARLAPILDTLRDRTSTLTIPPLVRLDRSAYRRKRSGLLDEAPVLPAQDFPPPHPPEAISQATTSQATRESRSPLIPLSLGSSKQPFFCVHPMFGVVFPYLELARCLSSDRSFYGLQPLGLDGTPPLNRIEAIAAYYIQAIQTLQPQGPYFLGGWSFGGLVAFEMAQQLTQAGQEIGLLAILDTPAPGHKLSFYQSLKFLLGTALWSTLPFLLDYGKLATHQLQAQSWFSRWQWTAIAGQIPEEARLQLLDESAIRTLLPIVYANSQAAYRYVPQPYPDRVTLFRAVDQPDALKHEPTLSWNTLAKDIQLHQVPGNHLSLLKQPHVQILAQQLGRCLS